jgi:hypothetical protein
MRSRFATIAMIVITALILSTLAAVSSAKTNAHDAASISTQNNTTAELRTDQEPALTPNPERFQPQFVVSVSAPNFNQPIRRAPIRRKGRVKH